MRNPTNQQNSMLNKKDSVMYNASSGDAVAVDGIAPYRWTGPNAQARWFRDAERWVHDFGVENETIVCDRIVLRRSFGTYAYVVLSATRFFTVKAGRSGSTLGVLSSGPWHERATGFTRDLFGPCGFHLRAICKLHIAL
jgi:hypothetical protein